MRLALESPTAAGEVFNLCETQRAPIRLWIEQIVAASDVEMELVRVPNQALPVDLEITGDIAQHWMASPEKARHVLDWQHADPEECVGTSVRWHLDCPPPTDGDFSADERALAASC